MAKQLLFTAPSRSTSTQHLHSAHLEGVVQPSALLRQLLHLSVAVVQHSLQLLPHALHLQQHGGQLQSAFLPTGPLHAYTSAQLAPSGMHQAVSTSSWQQRAQQLLLCPHPSKLLPPVTWQWVEEGDGYVRHVAWCPPLSAARALLRPDPVWPAQPWPAPAPAHGAALQLRLQHSRASHMAVLLQHALLLRWHVSICCTVAQRAQSWL